VLPRRIIHRLPFMSSPALQAKLAQLINLEQREMCVSNECTAIPLRCYICGQFPTNIFTYRLPILRNIGVPVRTVPLSLSTFAAARFPTVGELLAVCNPFVHHLSPFYLFARASFSASRAPCSNMHLLFVLERVLSLHDDTIKIPPPPDERYKRIDESFPRYDILVTGKRSFTLPCSITPSFATTKTSKCTTKSCNVLFWQFIMLYYNGSRGRTLYPYFLARHPKTSKQQDASSFVISLGCDKPFR
jgi:hypothetical protein